MKKLIFLMMILCVGMLNAQTTEEVQLSVSERDALVEAFEDRVYVAESVEEKKFFKRLAESLKDIKIAECEGCDKKAKRKLFWQQTGRGAGKASLWLSVKTLKPFMNAASFVTGFFEKPEKNKDVVEVYKFFLAHIDSFDNLYKDAKNAEEYASLIQDQLENILTNKQELIFVDYIYHLTQKDPSLKELDDVEILSTGDMEDAVEFINNHQLFSDLKPIVGPLDNKKLETLVETQDATAVFDIFSDDLFERSLPKIHEGISAVAGQIFLPRLALSIASKTLANIYVVPVVLADIGAAISLNVCLKEKNKQKIKEDKSLSEFCSYAVNQSAFDLMKSRMKGYNAGKKSKINFKKKLQERRERRKTKKLQ